VPDPDWLLFPSVPLPCAVLAYVGLGPGQELIPYFLALLGFIGAAFLAILQWPLLALRRLFSRKSPARGHRKDEGAGATDLPETPGEATPNKP